MLVRALVALTAGLTITTTAQAQGGLIGRVKDKAKEQLDKKKKDEPKPDSSKTAPAAAKSNSTASEADTSKAFVNYDFVPGDKVLFAEDFSNDKVGDLPSRVKVESGNWEVASYKGQRFLRASGSGDIMIPLPSTLPQKATIEMDLIHSWGLSPSIMFVPDQGDQRHTHQSVFVGSTGGIGEFSSQPTENKDKELYHVRLMLDGEHAKVYEDGKRVANVPTAKLGRANGVWVHARASNNEPFYITNIRIAESNTSLFDALNASGRVATHGILFDVNSDHIRPESAPTLLEIADMLKAHSDLKLTIEGHTDNTGDPAANQALSERRAASVKSALVSNYGIDASRLATKGFGASKPAASNDTAEGRQQNRRVELVKM
jgi:outer membrane protein OmpA-like peptidoglycan-associated protein